MTRSRLTTLLAGAAAVPLVALAVAGCGGSDNGASAASAASQTESGHGSTVGVANAGGLGKILVDSQGRTLYLFKKDTGTKSECSGACAAPGRRSARAASRRSAAGRMASMLGTTARSDGKPQVTYNGHPLYLYSGDQNPGDTTGQGLTAFGAAWYAVSPAGDQITAQPSSSGGGASSSGGG